MWHINPNDAILLIDLSTWWDTVVYVTYPHDDILYAWLIHTVKFCIIIWLIHMVRRLNGGLRVKTVNIASHPEIGGRGGRRSKNKDRNLPAAFAGNGDHSTEKFSRLTLTIYNQIINHTIDERKTNWIGLLICSTGVKKNQRCAKGLIDWIVLNYAVSATLQPYNGGVQNERLG